MNLANFLSTSTKARGRFHSDFELWNWTLITRDDLLLCEGVQTSFSILLTWTDTIVIIKHCRSGSNKPQGR